MTLAELQAMTEREIDALVAEKVLPKKFAKEEDRQRCIPHFSTDLNLAAQVEEKVIEKGLGDAMLTGLWEITETDMETWRATARERVIACLLAWEEK
jgi:hypothetical protein